MAEVFAGLVRLHRQASFPNQTTAARELGYDQSWLSRVETGQHVPDRETVIRMEQRFDCVPGTLMITYEALVVDETVVRARLDRQAILSRDNAPTLACFIEEPVLLRDVGGAEVMRNQLEHLVKCVSSRVMVQVTPLRIHASLDGSFVLAVGPDGEAGYVGAVTGDLVTTSDTDITRLKGAWKSVRDTAYPLVDTLELIKRVKEEQWS